MGGARCRSVRCPLPSTGADSSATLTRSCRGGAPSFIPHRPGWSLTGAGTGLAPAPASAGPAGDAAAPAPGGFPALDPRSRPVPSLGVPVAAPRSGSCSQDPSSAFPFHRSLPPGRSRPLPGSQLCLSGVSVPALLVRDPGPSSAPAAHNRGRCIPRAGRAGRGDPPPGGGAGGQSGHLSRSGCPVTGVKVSPCAGNQRAEPSWGAELQGGSGWRLPGV